MSPDKEHTEPLANGSPAKGKISLSKLIFRQYARTALFVILTIEVMLLAMYFWTTSKITKRAKELAMQSARMVASREAERMAGVPFANFKVIEDLAESLAAAHVPLFTNPESFTVPGEQPVFEKAPNGSIFQSNLTNGSSFYASASTAGLMTAKQWQFATNSAVFNPLYKAIVDGTPGLVAAYINVDEPADMNRLYPFIKDAWKQYPPDLDMKNYNFFYLADKEHDPDRKAQWTGVYLDPAGNGWMISCVAPVYADDKLEAVVGLDVALDKAPTLLAARDNELPWESISFLINTWFEEGTVRGLMMANKSSYDMLGLKPPDPPERSESGQYKDAVNKDRHEKTVNPISLDIDNIKDAEFRETLRTLLARSGSDVESIAIHGDVYMVARYLPPDWKSGWQSFVLIKEADVQAPINELASMARNIGWSAVGVMTLFYVGFFVFLWDRAGRMATEIAQPLRELSHATTELGTDAGPIGIPESGIEEIDRLGANFTKMSASLAERSRELVMTRVDSEMKTKNAELAHAVELYNSAAANLHDAGNAVTGLESSLIDLKKAVKSADQYPEVFRQLKAGGPGSGRLLDRFEEVLVTKTMPRLDDLAKSIERVKNTIKNSIREQQAIFRKLREQRGGKRQLTQMSETIDLTGMLEELCGVFRRNYPALETDIAPGITVRSHRTPLWSGIDNIIRNAIQASPHSGRIRVSAAAAENGATVTVTDSGNGIAVEYLAKVTERGFTTRETGLGLGLSNFKGFLETFGGILTIRSEGEGRGTTVTAEIRNA